MEVWLSVGERCLSIAVQSRSIIQLETQIYVTDTTAEKICSVSHMLEF